jgi:hypothetical protein
METMTASISKRAALIAKVATMSEDEKIARLEQIYAMRGSGTIDTDTEFSVLSEYSSLVETLKAKVASMTPAQRVERREQIYNAAPSHAGDHEFCLLTASYDEKGEPR